MPHTATGRVSRGLRWAGGLLFAGGMALVGVQLLLFSTLDAGSTFWNLLPALLIGGVGMSMTMTPATAAAMKAVPRDKAGVGSAVLNAFRQVGGSIGVAMMGAIMASRASTPPSVAGFLDGLHAALLVAAGIAFAGAIVAYILVRNTHHEPQPQVVPDTLAESA